MIVQLKYALTDVQATEPVIIQQTPASATQGGPKMTVLNLPVSMTVTMWATVTKEFASVKTDSPGLSASSLPVLILAQTTDFASKEYVTVSRDTMESTALTRLVKITVRIADTATKIQNAYASLDSKAPTAL